MSKPQYSIRATGLGKRFPIRDANGGSHDFWAVRDVSFDIAKGQVVGIMGRNGSGKTTLLKMLCQVTPPTEGSAEISGRISAMLGVGTGMHPGLSGRDNVTFAGMLLGLDRELINDRMESIVAFSEIGDFVNRPVKTYSSGMRSRLGFAIAAQLEPEILFLDEVLAVGDAGFQQKCLERIREMRSSGSTILLVTHNSNVIKSFCDRALLLDRGRLVLDGPPEDAVEYYSREIVRQGISTNAAGEAVRQGNGALRVEEFWFEDIEGRRIDAVPSGATVSLCLAYTATVEEATRNVSVGVAFADVTGRWLVRVATDISGQDFHKCPQEGVLRCGFPRLPIGPGQYYFGFRIVCEGEVADYVVNFGQFEVVTGDFFGTGQSDPHSPTLFQHTWSLSSDGET